MKKTYSRLCLKERWSIFAICLLLSIMGLAAGVYLYIHDQFIVMIYSFVAAIVCSCLAAYIYHMNTRRREIKREYNHEFDRELYAKERSCPKCGAQIGSNVCYCSRCGTRLH